MSDRMAAEIWIGGTIPKRLVPQLCDVICTEGASLDWDEAVFRPSGASELLETCRDEDGVRLLHLCNVEACWGEFGELEEFLVQHGISFRRRSEAKYEHDAEVVEHRTGVGPVRYPTDSSGKPFVPLADLIHVATGLDEAIESAAGNSLGQLLSRLRNVQRTIKERLPIAVPPLEPFEIVGVKWATNSTTRSKPMQVSFSVPTFQKTKTSDGFTELEVPVTVKLEQGIRLVLGKDDDESFVPHILIERRSRGWLVFLHPDGTEESCGYLFINDNGRIFAVPGNRFGCAEPMEFASLKQYDAIEAMIDQAGEPRNDESDFIDTAEERSVVIAEKDKKHNLFGPDPGDPR